MESAKSAMLEENAMTDSQMRNTKAYKRLIELRDRGQDKVQALLMAGTENLREGLKKGQLGMIHRYVYESESLSSYMTPEEIDYLAEKNKTLHLFTRFRFLLKHFGLRPSCIHTLLGESGQGKSSLVRSIIIDSAISGNVLVYLSEEEIIQYQSQLNMVAKEFIKDDERRKVVLSRIKMISELELTTNNFLNFWTALIEKRVIKDQIKLFVFDNFSTSAFSDMFPSDQAKVFKSIKALAVKYEIPVLILVHPEKGALRYQKELDQSLIRGNSIIKNLSEYIYCIQSCMNLNPIRTFIKIDKARHHNEANKQYFELVYKKINESSGVYYSDLKITRAEVIECLTEDRKS